jgi:hypothetical protein
MVQVLGAIHTENIDLEIAATGRKGGKMAGEMKMIQAMKTGEE